MHPEGTIGVHSTVIFLNGGNYFIHIDPNHFYLVFDGLDTISHLNLAMSNKHKGCNKKKVVDYRYFDNLSILNQF